MSIDISSTSIITGFSTTGASNPDLAADARARHPARGAAHEADHPQEVALQDATVVTISDDVEARQRSADEQAVREAAQEALARAVADAASRDWAHGMPAVDNGVAQEALEALDQASRANLSGPGDALAADSEHVALEEQAARDVAEKVDEDQRALDVAVTNASVQLAYGALSSPLAGDAVLRQPGLELFV